MVYFNSNLTEGSDMAWVNTSPLVKTYTLEEFWELPEPADHSKLELIAGVLYMTPPPAYPHCDVVSKLNRLITEFLIRTEDTGTLLVPRAAIWTSPNTYLEPDLFYVSAETDSRLDTKHRTTADLVVEVVSTGSAIYDRNTKADTYAALGVKELWLVDESAGTVEVRNLCDGRLMSSGIFEKDDKLASQVFPAIKIRVDQMYLAADPR
jgi:Uma2 family endonuclease